MGVEGRTSGGGRASGGGSTRRTLVDLDPLKLYLHMKTLRQMGSCVDTDSDRVNGFPEVC